MPKHSKERETLNAATSRLSALKPASISTDALMGGGKELIILHNEEQYLLRITRNGKLILTK
jgi:hemin uptake protein HemP